MTAEEQRRVIDRYNERLAQHGQTAQALGWRDTVQQQLRFRILAEVGDCSGTAVLDVGCGFGDLCDFLAAAGARDFTYTGTDVVPAMLDIARTRHPAATFHLAGDLTGFADESHDFVFLSGLFNFRVADNTGFMRETVRQSFRVARRAVAFNLLGSYVDFREEHLFYHREEEAFAFAKSLTRFVNLRADYPLHEFTMHLYKPAAVLAK
jgi:ubiquinone/menaquinone biosynthesis C-methylase UbiE